MIHWERNFLADGARSDSVILLVCTRPLGPPPSLRGLWLRHHLFTVKRYVTSATLAQDKFPGIILDIDPEIVHAGEALLAAAAVALALVATRFIPMSPSPRPPVFSDCHSHGPPASGMSTTLTQHHQQEPEAFKDPPHSVASTPFSISVLPHQVFTPAMTLPHQVFTLATVLVSSLSSLGPPSLKASTVSSSSRDYSSSSVSGASMSLGAAWTPQVVPS